MCLLFTLSTIYVCTKKSFLFICSMENAHDFRNLVSYCIFYSSMNFLL
jgi:hypothetical protein